MTKPYVCPQCGPDPRGEAEHAVSAHTVDDDALVHPLVEDDAPPPRLAYEHDRVTVWSGDCLDALRNLADESVDAVVCDPPYSLEFMGKAWDRHENEDAGFGYYLSGLVDGEGHFRVGVAGSNCEFSIKLRDDDRWVLEQARQFIGHGRITREVPAAAKPQSKLIIDTKAGCDAVRALLMRYPLRAKKLRDFITWAEAVDEWVNLPRGNRWTGPADRTRLAELGQRLRDGRTYSEVPWSGNGFQDWCRQWSAECLRVLKPGGYLLAFGGSRTYHRLTCGIEDAGFEVRDTIMWLYGQGFPKSLNVSVAIDKAAGAARPVVGQRVLTGTARIVGGQGGASSGRADELYATKELRDTLDLTAPATEDAKTWDGWGTALKPSHEPIVVARKPFTRTVADNVLTYGTGALNIDGTRSAMSDADAALIDGKHAGMDAATYERAPGASLRLSVAPMPLQPAKAHAAGRWPSNVILTHAQDCTRTGSTTEVVGGGQHGSSGFVDGYEPGAGFVGREVTVDVWDCAPGCPVAEIESQTPGAARYFTTTEWEHEDDEPLPTPGAYYVAKATTRERPSYAREDADGSVPLTPKASGRQCRVCGNRTVPPGGSPWPACGHEDWEPFVTDNAARGRVAHPTVKPVAVMRHLVRLVTPPNGLVLDPFAGSGTTGEAALLEGMRSVLVEREPDYLPLIAQRMDRHLDAAAWLRSTGQADGTLFG